MVNAAHHRALHALIVGWLCVCAGITWGQTDQTTTHCEPERVALQVLGSGGPEADDGRASSGYLIWLDQKATAIVDLGTGSLARLEETGARIDDIDSIFLTHLHTDHSADLPGLLKASFFTPRREPLHIFGPTGNHRMPGLDAFIEALFGKNGAYRYLNDYLPPPAGTGKESFSLITHEVSGQGSAIERGPILARAVAVSHGPIPALAWSMEIAGCNISFTGDLNDYPQALEESVQNTHLLVAHLAIPESAGSIAKSLHMPPSKIGQLAQASKAKRLLLSHRMKRTLGREKPTIEAIKQHFNGVIILAEDGMVVSWD